MDSVESTTAGHRWRRVFAHCAPWLVCLGLIIAVAMIYTQVIHFKFLICDDNQYVYENPNITQGLTLESVTWAARACHAGNWHPLSWMSHMLDVQLYNIWATRLLGAAKYSGALGAEIEWQRQASWAGMHHLTSAVLHAVNAVLLFLAARMLTGRLWLSALLAAVFAVHPLRVESVAWISERKDMLSGMFWMLTLLSYAWYVRRPSILRYMAVSLSLALGLAAKSMLVTIPCVLLLLDIWPLARWRPAFLRPAADDPQPPRCEPRTLGFLLLEKLPLFLMAFTVAYVIWYSQAIGGAMTMLRGVTFGDCVANALVSYPEYLYMTVWPVNLAIFYPHPAVVGVDGPLSLVGQAIVATLFIVTLTIFCVWQARRRPYLLMGWLWYLGTLLPVIGLVRIGAHSVADRYTYLPMIGVYIMVLWAAAELAARSDAWRWSLTALAVALLGLWMHLAVKQAATWENSEVVFQRATEVVPRNFFAFNHLGLVYFAAGDIEAAGKNFQRTVELAPLYDSGNLNLGVYYLHPTHNDLEKAADCFRKTKSINPRLACAASNLGIVYLRQNRLEEALVEFLLAGEIEPGYDSAWLKAAMCCYDMKRYQLAVDYAFRAVQANRNSPDNYHVLGTALLALGQADKAAECLERAVLLMPMNADLRNRLGVAYMYQGRTADGQVQIENALRIDPNHTGAKENLRRIQERKTGPLSLPTQIRTQ